MLESLGEKPIPLPTARQSESAEKNHKENETIEDINFEAAFTNKKLRFLKIQGEYKTTFWRYQHHGSGCLATVEAVYYFFKELADLGNKPAFSKNIEFIMFFYILQFRKLFRRYKLNDVRGRKNQDYFGGIKKIK